MAKEKFTFSTLLSAGIMAIIFYFIGGRFSEGARPVLVILGITLGMLFDVYVIKGSKL